MKPKNSPSGKNPTPGWRDSCSVPACTGLLITASMGAIPPVGAGTSVQRWHSSGLHQAAWSLNLLWKFHASLQKEENESGKHYLKAAFWS